MKINLPKRYKEMWIVLKDNKPQYLYLASDDMRRIKKVYDLSVVPNNVFVLPPINFSSEERNLCLLAEGQYNLDSYCFPYNDGSPLTLIVTGKSNASLNFESFGGKERVVSLILPKDMAMFKIYHNYNSYDTDSWYLIADEKFDTKNVDLKYVKETYVSEKVDFAVVGKKKILVNNKFVYENGEILETGKTNEDRDSRIKKSEDEVKKAKKYPNADYSISG